VTIRLLDPPLHEFLPQNEGQISALARDMGWGFVDLRAKVNQLHEGHRGCRLGITFPEIYEMQVRAIFQAACDVKKDGIDVYPEVMIPRVGTVKELQTTAEMTRRVAAETARRDHGVLLVPHQRPDADDVLLLAPFRQPPLASQIVVLASFVTSGLPKNIK
jgi:pyruvate,orthophosphate dikinase